jgi:hypothetical protein
MVGIQSAHASMLDQPLTHQDAGFAGADEPCVASAGVMNLGHRRMVMPDYLAPGCLGVVVLS